jgi:hypothetical protein
VGGGTLILGQNVKSIRDYQDQKRKEIEFGDNIRFLTSHIINMEDNLSQRYLH